jgi:hypothetical protein
MGFGGMIGSGGITCTTRCASPEKSIHSEDELSPLSKKKEPVTAVFIDVVTLFEPAWAQTGIANAMAATAAMKLEPGWYLRSMFSPFLKVFSQIPTRQ